jgi:hypothetical protein
MPLALAHVVVDCQDAGKLAAFWSAVLERPVDPGGSAFFATIGRGGPQVPGPALMFLAVEEPKTVKNRLHLDLVAADWAGDLARLEQLGAERGAEFREYGTHWVTFRDPEGNEFDVAEAH